MLEKNKSKNLQRLYEHSDKMLSDDRLSIQDKRSLLWKWKGKFETKIGTTILSSSEVRDACEFIAHIKLRIHALGKEMEESQ